MNGGGLAAENSWMAGEIEAATCGHREDFGDSRGAGSRSFSVCTSGNGGCLRWFGFFFRLFLFWFLLFGLLFFRFLFAGLFGGFAGFQFFLGALLFLFEEFPLFLLACRAASDVALTVEVDAAVDQSFLHDGVGAQRVVIV